MSVPVSQPRNDVSYGELSPDADQPSEKRHRSLSPQGDPDSRGQELDPSL